MELNVNDDIIETPTAEDIVRALGAPSFPEDWYIILERDDGELLDAEAQDDGTFTLGNIDKTRKRHAVPNVNAATLKAVLLKFFNGAPDWDAACHWQADTPVKAQKSPMKFVPAKPKTLVGGKGGEPPAWAIIAVLATIGLIFVIVALSDWFPGLFPTSTTFYVTLIFLPVVVMLALMIGTKVWELKKAKGWSQTTGRIVKSAIEVQRHRFQDSAETVKNVPAVEYEFNVGSTKVRGQRIGIGDDAGGENTEATLKRYPVGATVTVYYDPNDPTQCVLERKGPEGITAKGCLGALGLLAALGGAIYWLIVYGPDFIAARFPNANAPVVVFAAGFGLVLVMFFIAARRTSQQASHWPFVSGTMVKSVVEEFQERNSDGKLRTSYRAAVEYAYAVNGLDYHGNQIKLGLAVSGSRGFAEKTVAKYPEGSAVEVHYDPANPSNAALENPTGATWIVAVMALACFALAVWQLGIFK